MSNTVLVQNELLAFAFDSLNADHRDSTEQIIDKFYDDSAVKDAKKLIWQEYVNSLPQWQNRRDTSTSAKTKDIGDIMSAVSTIDQKFSNKDELPVTFAAVKLSNVPSKQIREEPNILNRLQTLELQIKDVIADRKSYVAATRAHINDMTPATGAAPKSDGGLPNGAAANTTVVYDPAMQPQQQQPNGVDGADGANGIGDILYSAHHRITETADQRTQAELVLRLITHLRVDLLLCQKRIGAVSAQCLAMVLMTSLPLGYDVKSYLYFK